MSDLTFYDLPSGAYDVARLALEQARLPTGDLDRADLQLFGLSDERGPIGFIGLGGEGRERLLRSLVILPSRRGQGYGKTLVHRLETWASEGVDRFHLLTTHAAPFFRSLGYADAECASAPAAIAGTEQFQSLCPANAFYLTKVIQ